MRTVTGYGTVSDFGHRRDAIRAALVKIAAIFPPYQDMTEAQWDQFAEDYITDLSEFAVVEIDSAFLAYRQDPQSKGFPKPGRLRELAGRARADRIAVNQPRIVGARPFLWWTKPKRLWKESWHESEVPHGEKIRDMPGDSLRDPVR